MELSAFYVQYYHFHSFKFSLKLNLPEPVHFNQVQLALAQLHCTRDNKIVPYFLYSRATSIVGHMSAKSAKSAKFFI